MLRLKISVATVDVLWQNIVGISISAAALNEKAEERVPSEDGKPRILGDALGLRSTSLAIKHIISSSSSKPVLIVIFWSLLVLPVGLLDVREAHPGRVRLTSLKTTLFSISLWLRLKEGDAGAGPSNDRTVSQLIRFWIPFTLCLKFVCALCSFVNPEREFETCTERIRGTL